MADDDIHVKTEGQRRLLLLTHTHGEIADALGCSRQIVSYWRRGDKRPGRDKKAALARIFGIPSATWTERPEAESGAPAPDEPDTKPAAIGELTPLQHVEELLKQARDQRVGGNLAASELNKIMTLEAKLLDQREKLRREAHRAKAERAVLAERTVKENPAWASMLDLLRWLAAELADVSPELAEETERRIAALSEGSG